MRLTATTASPFDDAFSISEVECGWTDASSASSASAAELASDDDNDRDCSLERSFDNPNPAVGKIIAQHPDSGQLKREYFDNLYAQLVEILFISLEEGRPRDNESGCEKQLMTLLKGEPKWSSIVLAERYNMLRAEVERAHHAGNYHARPAIHIFIDHLKASFFPPSIGRSIMGPRRISLANFFPVFKIGDKELNPGWSLVGHGRPESYDNLYQTAYPRTVAQALRFLVAAGAPINHHIGGVGRSGASCMTPLCAAVDARDVGIATWLIDNGADINGTRSTWIEKKRDYILHNLSALHLAAMIPFPKMVELLLTRGARVDAKCWASKGPRIDTRFGRLGPKLAGCVSEVMPLHVAHGGCAGILIDSGADVNARDNRARTPLHWAAEAGNIGVVQPIFEKGHPADARDERGATPLALLCESVEQDMEYGAKFHANMAQNAEQLVEGGEDITMLYPQDYTLLDRLWVAVNEREEYRALFEKWGHLSACRARDEARKASRHQKLLLAGGMTRTANGWEWTETSVLAEEGKSWRELAAKPNFKH